MAEAAKPKRRRVTPTLVAGGEVALGGENAAAGSRQPEPTPLKAGCLWAADGELEVRTARDSRASSGPTTVTLLRKGVVEWERMVPSAVQKLALSVGFVAVAAGNELYVLETHAGMLWVPPLLMTATPVDVVLDGAGFLAVLLRSGELSVWHVPKMKRKALASMRAICGPGDVELIGVKSDTGEPWVRLADKRLYFYHEAMQGWVVMARTGGRAAPQQSGEGRPPGVDEAPEVCRGVVGGPQVEGDLLAAAHLGNAQEFTLQLEALVAYYAAAEPSRLRGWVSSLLGQVKPDLTSQLTAMRLDGPSLVRAVVLPALGAAGVPPDLKLDVEARLEAALPAMSPGADANGVAAKPVAAPPPTTASVI